MSEDLDKILERIDKVYEDSGNPPQAKRPEFQEPEQYDMKKIEFYTAWADLEQKRKEKSLELAKKVHEFIREVKKETLDDQANMLDKFKEAIELGELQQ